MTNPHWMPEKTGKARITATRSPNLIRLWIVAQWNDEIGEFEIARFQYWEQAIRYATYRSEDAIS